MNKAGFLLIFFTIFFINEIFSEKIYTIKILKDRVEKHLDEKKRIQLKFQDFRISITKKIKILEKLKKSIDTWLIKYQNFPQDDPNMQYLKKEAEETMPNQIKALYKQLKQQRINFLQSSSILKNMDLDLFKLFKDFQI